ncbi:hypothetical protein O9A_00057 [Bartonella koehlerae C-29]|uniref:Uncharacterized protein n=1 Tax=Bartonella koehlerae C-29 TaxID=1134510 RepID=A0A067WIG7_9HYPH|nr:hypothetical protein O9A_00057 [Bartonella koehlerae C-29]
MPFTAVSSTTTRMNMNTIVEIKQKLISQTNTRAKSTGSQCETILFGWQALYPAGYAPNSTDHTPLFTHHAPTSINHVSSSMHHASNTNSNTQSLPATLTNEENSNHSQANIKNPKSLQENTQNASSPTNHTSTSTHQNTYPKRPHISLNKPSSCLNGFIRFERKKTRWQKCRNYWHAKSGKEVLTVDWQIP